MKQIEWCGLALGSVMAFAACAQRDAVVKEPPAAPSTSAVEGSSPPAANDYKQVPSVNVLGNDAGAGIDAFALQGAAERVALSVIPVTGQPFDRALRAEIKEQSPNLWDVQLLATNKAEVYAGVVAEETPDSLRLLIPGGTEKILPRADIAKLERSNRSLMPEGIEGEWSDKDLADLLAFLVQ